MDYETKLALDAMEIQPCIGDEVIIVLPSGMFKCTYLGMKIHLNSKVTHTYDYQGELQEAEHQVGLPLEKAQELFN